MPDDGVDFANAELFLGKAREAYEGGDRTTFIACRKLVMVNLGIFDGPPVRVETAHLQDSDEAQGQ